MQLPDYLKKHRLTHSQFAKKVRVSQPHIANILSGKRRPSIELAKRIEIETGKAVMLDDLLALLKKKRMKIEEIKR